MATPLTHKTVTPECQVVVFKWKHEATTPHNNFQLAESTAFDISNYLQEVSFSKQMSSPAGQFQITLPNDRDWKQHIEKGSWLLIYMSQDGDLAIPSDRDTVSLTRKKLGDDIGKDPQKGLKGDPVNIASLVLQRKKLRCIGYVDTVRAHGTTGSEKGDFDVQYTVSGRDFGVVYEETEIWHNQVLFDATLLETINAKIAVSFIKTVDGLLSNLHKLFFSPDELVIQPFKNDSLTSIARQWLLPFNLFVALGIFPRLGVPYFGNIPGLLNFKSTRATYPVERPTDLLNGVAWDRLKSHSIEPYHELFPELSDAGLPRLTFRVIPWRVTNSPFKFPKLFRTADKFADEKNGVVEIPNLDIIDWDLGEDNHTRYNLFWSTINSSMISIQTSNALIGNNDPTTGFPRVVQESVKRHGLRMLYSEVNANIVIGKEEADADLLRQFNELALEFWQRSHEYESGTMTIIGNNEIRIGKVVHIESGSQYNSDKFFYIEGYEDTWTQVSEEGAAEWTQTLFLTRGIEGKALQKIRLLSARQTPFSDAGEFTRNKK